MICPQTPETDMTTTTTNEIDAPKTGTKEASLVLSLTGKGKSITQLSELLGWQPHTIRAAFTRLRKRGYNIERIKPEGDTPAVFRLKSAPVKRRRAKA
jgi:predicted ArsR family transcriptional regulator